MKKIYIETFGAGIIYESDIDLYNFFKENEKYLDFPGLKIYDTIPSDCSYNVKYIDGEKKYIKCYDTHIEICYPKQDLTPASIAYMGYILMEKQRAEKGLVTLHSACVNNGQDAIMLLGRTGSGKTSVAINLCKNKGYSLIGNDRNIIGLQNDKIIAYTGTQFLFLRYESIKRNLPELLYLFKKENIDNWLNKVKVDPNEINIKISNTCSEIRSTYIVHVDETQKNLFYSNGDTPANRLYLNELLSMYIRGIYTTFSDKNFHAKGYIPSYDSEENYYKRVKIIEKLISDCNLQYISGNVGDISNFIDEKQKKLVYNRKVKKGVNEDV